MLLGSIRVITPPIWELSFFLRCDVSTASTTLIILQQECRLKILRLAFLLYTIHSHHRSHAKHTRTQQQTLDKSVRTRIILCNISSRWPLHSLHTFNKFFPLNKRSSLCVYFFSITILTLSIHILASTGSTAVLPIFLFRAWKKTVTLSMVRVFAAVVVVVVI